MTRKSDEILIVGGGLAGCLVALELERRNQSFKIFDLEAGARCSRVAAGILNPLIGPRLSPPDFDWSILNPHYREIENRLIPLATQELNLYHPIEIFRPQESLLKEQDGGKNLSGSGWNAVRSAKDPGWVVQGGAWLDIPRLIDLAHQHFEKKKLLEKRVLDPQSAELADRRVVWCQGASIFDDPRILEGEASKLWQAVSGEILTVSVPGWNLNRIWIGTHFVLPLGMDRFRVGATHQANNNDRLPTTEGLGELEGFVGKLSGLPFNLISHDVGVRPATRTYQPVVGPHPQKRGWFVFNGFGGRGAARMVAHLPKLMSLLEA